MPMIRAMRLLNSVEAGTTSGAQLETLLTADPGRLAEFNVLMGMRGQTRRMAASSTAMNAVAASTTAMNAVIASSTAMNAVAASSTAMNAVAASTTAMDAVAASSTAMDAVAASSTAMNAVIASSTAKMSIFNSDTALAAIAASTTALTAMRAATTYVVRSVVINGTATIPNLNAGGSYILLGISSSNNPLNGNPIGVTTRRTGSTRANSGLLIAANAATAETTNLATPLVAPFNGTDGGGTGYTWYFGLLRCDV